MRLFVAIVPPDQVLEDLPDFLAPRHEVESGFRWTIHDQWHVTLAFMPRVEDRHLDDLEERCERAAARRTPFELRLHGGGAFPNPARAKVLYAGVDAAAAQDELDHLAVGMRAAANKAGAAVDGGRFHAHLTLARLGRPLEATRWIRVLDSYTGPPWTVGEVTLIESHLGEGPHRRPRYEVVGRFPLGTAVKR